MEPAPWRDEFLAVKEMPDGSISALTILIGGRGRIVTNCDATGYSGFY